jgi:hypothetical protein
MPTHHDDLELVAGDDWTIPGTLTEPDGTALDLTTVKDIQWIMLGPDGNPCLPPGSATVQVVSPPTLGQVLVTVPNVITRTLPAGRYVDAMRVVMSTSARATVWTGAIAVDANSFDSIDNFPTVTPLREQ